MIKLLISIGVLYYLFTKFSFVKVQSTFSNANILLLILSFSFGMLNLTIQILRWRYVLSITNHHESIIKIIKSFFIGSSAGLFTPYRFGELLARKLSIKHVKLSSIILRSLIDKLFLLVNIITFGGITTILFLKFYFGISDYIVGSLFVVYILLLGLIFILIFGKKVSSLIFKWLDEVISNKPRILNIIYELKFFSTGTRTKLFFLNLLNYFILIIQFSLTVKAFDVSSNFVNNGISAILMFFSKSFLPQVTIGEIGIREGATIFSLSLFGVADYVALNTAFCIFIVNLLFPAIIGLIILLIEKLSINGDR